jgi:hypothetical protein
MACLFNDMDGESLLPDGYRGPEEASQLVGIMSTSLSLQRSIHACCWP